MTKLNTIYKTDNRRQPKKNPIPYKDLISYIYFDSQTIEHKFIINKIKKMKENEFMYYLEYAKNYYTKNKYKISWTLLATHIDKYREKNKTNTFNI